MADYLLLSTNCLLHPATAQSLDRREIILNTALAWGSDPVRLLVRLYGGVGRFLYVEGPHRVWLTTLIEEGRDRGVLRHFRGQGDELYD
jgi:hypothetical protein